MLGKPQLGKQGLQTTQWEGTQGWFVETSVLYLS